MMLMMMMIPGRKETLTGCYGDTPAGGVAVDKHATARETDTWQQ
jgi:hypothetical protein